MNNPAAKKDDIMLLRIIATLAVVNTHVNSMVSANAELFSLTDTQKTFFDVAKSCTPWHVPLFFMLTGWLLLDQKRELSLKGACRYALRILLALSVFGIPFAILESVYRAKSFSFSAIGQALLNALNGDNWDHLWYLYVLVGIYLLLPVFKRFTDNASRKELGGVLWILFVFNFCFPLINELAGTHIGFISPITYPIFYLLLGRYLTDESSPPPPICFTTKIYAQPFLLCLPLRELSCINGSPALCCPIQVRRRH